MSTYRLDGLGVSSLIGSCLHIAFPGTRKEILGVVQNKFLCCMNCHYNGLPNILNLFYCICKYNLYLLFKISCIGQMFYCAADESHVP